MSWMPSPQEQEPGKIGTGRGRGRGERGRRDCIQQQQPLQYQGQQQPLQNQVQQQPLQNQGQQQLQQPQNQGQQQLQQPQNQGQQQLQQPQNQGQQQLQQPQNQGQQQQQPQYQRRQGQQQQQQSHYQGRQGQGQRARNPRSGNNFGRRNLYDRHDFDSDRFHESGLSTEAFIRRNRVTYFRDDSGRTHSRPMSEATTPQISPEDEQAQRRFNYWMYEYIVETPPPQQPFEFETPQTDEHKKALEFMRELRQERHLIKDLSGRALDCRSLHGVDRMCQFCDGRRGPWAKDRGASSDVSFSRYQGSFMAQRESSVTIPRRVVETEQNRNDEDDDGRKATVLSLAPRDELDDIEYGVSQVDLLVPV